MASDQVRYAETRRWRPRRRTGRRRRWESEKGLDAGQKSVHPIPGSRVRHLVRESLEANGLPTKKLVVVPGRLCPHHGAAVGLGGWSGPRVGWPEARAVGIELEQRGPIGAQELDELLQRSLDLGIDPIALETSEPGRDVREDESNRLLSRPAHPRSAIMARRGARGERIIERVTRFPVSQSCRPVRRGGIGPWSYPPVPPRGQRSRSWGRSADDESRHIAIGLDLS